MPKIFVGNLPWNTTDDILLQEFSQHGHVTDCIVMKDRETGRSRGFGWVTFATETEADNAVRMMNEVDLNGRRIRIHRLDAKPPGRGYSLGSSGYGSGYGDYAGGYVGLEGEVYSNIISPPAFDPRPPVEVGYDDTQIMNKTSAIVVDDDESSEASSDGPAGSIFSIASRGSLSSALTENLKGSAYSAEQIEIATLSLLSMLQDDEVLVPLYIAAAQNDSIGPYRLENNFRRLLKLYSEHLKEEAHDSLELLAARLVAVKAKFLAKSIVDKYINGLNTGSDGAEASKGMDTVIEEGSRVMEDESDEEGDPTSYGDVFEDFAKVREFLHESNSFQTLHIQLQDFVNRNKLNTKRPPPSVNRESSKSWFLASGMIGAAALFITFAGMFIAISIRSLAFFAISIVFVLDIVVRFLPWAYKPILDWLEHGFINPMAEYIRHRVGGMLQRETQCPPGDEQIEWQCKCGVRGLGHVREIRPGGIAKLKTHMERTTGVTFRSLSNGQTNPNQRYTIQYVWATARAAVINIWGSSQNATSLPTHNAAQPTTSAQTVQNSNIPGPQQLLLMSCMRKENQSISLYQDDVTTLQCDRDLFYFLKARYRERRGRLNSMLSLRKVIGIHLIKFFVSISNNVEVRYHKACCRDQSCECIPPKDLVDPGGSHPEYRCEPVPSDSIPPMLPDYLSHLFNSPSCVLSSDKVSFEQLPKRTKGKLVAHDNQRAKGWGIFYEEGWDLVKIVWLQFLVIFLGSLLFAVLWAVFQRDTQGAFGIAAWWVAMGGSTLALFAISSSRI